MTVTLFIFLATALCAVSALLTEAVKAFMGNIVKKNYASNLIALIDAAVVGCGGTAIAYILLDIPFNKVNITCLILMTAVIWVGSMVGYDKVLQLIKQITNKEN